MAGCIVDPAALCGMLHPTYSAAISAVSRPSSWTRRSLLEADVITCTAVIGTCVNLDGIEALQLFKGDATARTLADMSTDTAIIRACVKG